MTEAWREKHCFDIWLLVELSMLLNMSLPFLSRQFFEAEIPETFIL
jgi:hypothetical protein